MAYQAIDFPSLKLRHGFRVETSSPINVIGNFAREYRIQRYSQAKNVFIFPARNLTWTDWQVLKTFFEQVGWERDSFRFTRPDNGEVVTARLLNIPSVEIVTLKSDNTPGIVSVSEIQLTQLLNEPTVG